jgi:acyl-ACP thioesterase
MLVRFIVTGLLSLAPTTPRSRQVVSSHHTATVAVNPFVRRPIEHTRYRRRVLAADMVAVPTRGRVFTRSRRVRLGDVSPGGRLRLDAFACYLQDISNDDTRDAEFDDIMGWVVRRTVVVVEQFARLAEVVEAQTFCSGTGSRWAERRVSVRGDEGAVMEAATLWVHVDLDTLRPKVLSPEFFACFGESAAGRTVRARLSHAEPPADAERRPWTLRYVDYDVLGHMNNAAYWAVVEEELGRRRDLRAPLRAELEFRNAVERGHQVDVITEPIDGGVAVWLVGDTGMVHASARLTVAR